MRRKNPWRQKFPGTIELTDHRMELLDEEMKEQMTPIVVRLRLHDTRTCRHAPKSDVSRQHVWSNWSDMLRKKKKPQHAP